MTQRSTLHAMFLVSMGLFAIIAVIVVAVLWSYSQGHMHGDGELCGWNDTKGGRIEVRCDHPAN